MARMRSVKPEFWADEDIAMELSRDARLLYVGLWNLADEHARLRGDPRYIKGQLLPYDDDLSPAHVDRLLDEIAESGRAQRYQVKGRSYLFLPKLARHQRLEAEKVPSRLPGPDEADPGTDESARRADELPLKHVAGGMEHVAGGMEESEIGEADPDAEKPEPIRDDVERLCNHLADRMVENGCKRPTVGDRWRDAARLMLDRDGRTEDDIRRAIDWCQNDEFWRQNILSMSKLREKYEQLRLAAQAKRARPTNQHVETTAGDQLAEVFG